MMLRCYDRWGLEKTIVSRQHTIQMTFPRYCGNGIKHVLVSAVAELPLAITRRVAFEIGAG
jgi:hypothetical protein